MPATAGAAAGSGRAGAMRSGGGRASGRFQAGRAGGRVSPADGGHHGIEQGRRCRRPPPARAQRHWPSLSEPAARRHSRHHRTLSLFRHGRDRSGSGGCRSARRPRCPRSGCSGRPRDREPERGHAASRVRGQPERRGALRGRYTVLRVRRIEADGFQGNWSSGGPMPTASGYFCAKRAADSL